MRKRVVFLIIGVLLVLPIVCYGQMIYKSNAYQLTTDLDATNTYRSITFTLPSRDLTIHNHASSGTVCVDITSADSTSCEPGNHFVMSHNTILTFRDYITEGISLMKTFNDASGVSVIATF